MKPVETPQSDTTYGGVASKEILDLPTQTLIETLPDRSIVQVHRSVWELEPTERAAIMLGARFVLDVFGGGVPPMRIAVEEPRLDDPETVYRLVDEAIAIAAAGSIASVLRDVGIERDVATIVAWSDEDKKDVSAWLRKIGDGEPLGLPADVLGLSDEELAKAQEARDARIAGPTDA